MRMLSCVFRMRAFRFRSIAVLEKTIIIKHVLRSIGIVCQTKRFILPSSPEYNNTARAGTSEAGQVVDIFDVRTPFFSFETRTRVRSAIE